MSQILDDRCCSSVDAQSEAVLAMNANAGELDLEQIFKAQYARIARVIASVIRDRWRAEEVAVDVFLKWSKYPAAQIENPEGWLYRTAIRMALNELRRETRRNRYEALFGLFSTRTTNHARSAEDLTLADEEREHVRAVLKSIKQRDAELLLLRSSDFTYEEIAAALENHFPRWYDSSRNSGRCRMHGQHLFDGIYSREIG
jgi:DNA-directed RNA polymerase specialized sigma24 family protein